MATVFDPWLLAQTSADVAMAGQLAPQALQRLQRGRLDSLLRTVRQRSALYRQRMKGLAEGADALPALPPISRNELMARFSDWVGDPALQLDPLRAFLADRANVGEPYLDRYLVWESSGTSGAPGIFVQDARCLAIYDALEALRRSPAAAMRRWLDPFYLGERIAFVGAIDGPFASYITIERLRRVQPWLASSVRSFSILQPLDALVEQLNEFAPTVLATYPTAAILIANEAEAGNFQIRMREIWTGGETLSTQVRRRLTELLGCPVRNSYGASEFLALGWECDQGQLHLNSDWVLLEPVDERYRPMPPGHVSAALLLTHLANTVQPLIRYEISDQLCLWTEPCPCGSGLPAFEVQGRQDDILYLRGRNRRPVALLPLALTTVLEEEAGLFEFQIGQRDERTLVLRLPLAGADGRAALARGRQALCAYAVGQGAVKPIVVGELGHPVPRGRSGKSCRILPGSS